MSTERRDKNLAKAIENLPQFSPENDLWGKVEEEIGAFKTQKEKKRFVTYYAAAFILLGSVTWFLAQEKRDEKPQVSFSEEYLPEVENPELDALENESFNSFLQSQCAVNNLCDDADFQRLLSQWYDLQAEVDDLNQLVDEAGNGLYIMKAKSRLEREDSDIKKRIIAYIKG